MADRGTGQGQQQSCAHHGRAECAVLLTDGHGGDAANGQESHQRVVGLGREANALFAVGA
jgi:hypothetical protein